LLLRAKYLFKAAKYLYEAAKPQMEVALSINIRVPTAGVGFVWEGFHLKMRILALAFALAMPVSPSGNHRAFLNSASASRFTACASGFLNLSQSGERRDL
jgi:hypothetical protein